MIAWGGPDLHRPGRPQPFGAQRQLARTTLAGVVLRSILPPIHDGELTLPRLELYAIAFDEISDETGAHYSASAFVAWLKAELDAPTATSQRIRPGRRQEGLSGRAISHR